jgi:hypothetical protein
VYERLLENWLTDVNELGYQLPFCEALVAEGYTILHVSRHGRGEHGKDVVARRHDGVLCSFQLKGGDIVLSEWRKIRGEVEELVQLPVRIPGVSEDEQHIPHLVTNGELRGDAPESIQRFVDLWEQNGYPRMEVWQRGRLLKLFLDAHGSFLPGGLNDFRTFIQLYTGQFTSPLPKAEFAGLLEPISAATQGLSATKMPRALASLAILASYVVEQYSRAGNHIAAAEGWTIAAAAVLHAAERDNLDPHVYGPTLSLLNAGVTRELDTFANEALEGESWLVPTNGLADPHVYGARVTIMLGWLAAWALNQNSRAGSVQRRQFLKVAIREYGARGVAGEVDWPFLLAFALWLDREGYAGDAETVVLAHVNAILASNRGGQKAPGMPSPYWSHEQVLRLDNGMLAPYEKERFADHSYTIWQALEMLVRRLRRQAVRGFWPETSRLKLCDFSPNRTADQFLWRCDTGTLYSSLPDRTASWSAWRSAAAAVHESKVPAVLIRHPEWLLPFLLTYPHRATQACSGLADALIGRRATVVSDCRIEQLPRQ